MKKYQRQYPLFSLCGLNCGLCPNYYTNGASRCSGCGGESFFNPACAVIAYIQQYGGIEYCYLCDEYPCKRYDGADTYDSFITHRNQLKDNDKIKNIGFDAYQAELNEKVEILRFLLDNYNDGRRKNFFCIAVNLLELQDVKYVMEQIEAETKTEMATKEKAGTAVHLFQAMADKHNITLKLCKKPKT